MKAAFRIRFGGYQGPESVHTRGMEAFAAALDDLTGGEVQVELQRNVTEQGHKAADLLDLTERGKLDACYFSSSYLAGRVPSLSLFDQHFAVPDRAGAFALLDGALGARLAADVAERTGFSVLGVWDNGLRHISTAARPVRRPVDCAGLSLRTLANEDHQRLFRALGFVPRVVDVKDLAGAVARGEIDAQENPLTNIFRFGLHETHRCVTMTGHLLGIALVLFNRAALSGWPAEIRQAVAQAVRESERVQRALALEEDEVCTRELQRAGVVLVPLSDAERDGFRDALAPELSRSRARLAPDLLDLFDTARGAQPEPLS